MDQIEIEILDDGTIKSTTNKVSAPNHQLAENFLAYVATLAGGETKVEKRGKAHTHHHGHGHEHSHQ